MLEELFVQHPLPWVFDSSRNHEGYICVCDAAGGVTQRRVFVSERHGFAPHSSRRVWERIKQDDTSINHNRAR